MHLKTLTVLLLCFSAALFSTERPISADQAIQKLIEGNLRYTKDKLEHPNRTTERREAVLSRQQPFATIVGCSDSRVSPEIVFDQGIGDLFVVRIAGNVVGPLELDSIDYAALYLDSSVVLVLGHENCGAVKAVLDQTTTDIEGIAKLIEPAVKIAATQKGNPLQNAILQNVRQVVAQLRQAKVLSKLIEQNKIKVIGGYYNLSSGKVEIVN